jgi:hypothetical protein
MLTDLDESFFAEDGTRTGAVDFDYDAVDRNLFTGFDPKENDFDRAGNAILTLLRWQWQDGSSRNMHGMAIRAMINCWRFIPELQGITETDLALRFGLQKQSVGRWASVWGRDFGSIIPNPHMINR